MHRERGDNGTEFFCKLEADLFTENDISGESAAGCGSAVRAEKVPQSQITGAGSAASGTSSTYPTQSFVLLYLQYHRVSCRTPFTVILPDERIEIIEIYMSHRQTAEMAARLTAAFCGIIRQTLSSEAGDSTAFILKI